ncbi:MAG: methyltransferase domain-containing protein [Actinomycetota bacterium]
MEVRQSDYENYDYRQFWEDDRRLYEDMSERIALKKMLAPIKHRSGVFADVGCGYGRLFNEYKDFGTILLLDYSMKNLKVAKDNIGKYLGPGHRKLSSVHFIAADALKLPIRSDMVDVLMTVRVVHHLSSPQFYFDQVYRVLKGGGTYILEFANKRNAKNILRGLVGRMDTSPYSLTPSRVGETILNYHPAYILGMLAQREFKVLKMLSVSNFRLQAVKKIVPLKALLALENFYQNVFSLLNFGPSIFLKAELLKKPKNYVRPEGIEDILACPQCSQPELNLEPDRVRCTVCGREYPVKGGIFNFKQ